MMLKRLSVALLIAASLASVAAAPAPTPARVPAAPAPADPVQFETRHVPLSKLGDQSVLRLRTTEGNATVNFGNRVDEQIVRAVLKLRYTYSPSLIPEQSHIRVLLNQEVVGVISVTREGAGRTLTQELEIDPRFITGFNQMTLQFIGHYTAVCEDPLHSSLWADISGTSELELTVRKLALGSDLGQLPEPFFDARSEQRLTLPFAFGAAPSPAVLRAAAITSSWFGKLAAWRGARFPAALDVLPQGHAVVFATNTERPAALGTMPSFKGPAISVMTNPADGRSKLLLISGRDGADLAIAATALVLGNAALSGNSVAVASGVGPAKPRQAYDAPNWVRLDRPMKFGELIDNPQQLQVFGHVPQPVRVNVRIPPDLFTWRSRGVAVDLKFRYTPPIRASESRMAMSINDELVEAVNLRASGQNGDAARVVLPLLDEALLGASREMLIPAFKLGPRNELQYGFSFTYQKEGQCRDTQVENVRAMIDADSTIDFSGYPHYAEMPQLNYFSSAGFPFTKYADLAQTAVVMPRVPNAQDIEVMLTLLGRMGESTGYPGTRVQVIGPGDSAAMKDRDLLVIGTAANQPLLARWDAKLPAMINGDTRRISQPVRASTLLFDRLGFGTAPDPEVGTQEQITGSGPLALLTGFESPLTGERSVVAVTAARPEHMLQLLDVLEDRGVADSMHGSAVFVRNKKVESMLTGSTYTIGFLPFWTAIWYPLSGHPILLALLSVLAVIVFAFALWRALKAVAQRRLDGGAK
jgi:hypothetical protein